MAQQSVFGRVQDEGSKLIKAIGSITYHCVQEKFGKNSIRGKDFMRRPRGLINAETSNFHLTSLFHHVKIE